jgi:hypothetical protein
MANKVQEVLDFISVLFKLKMTRPKMICDYKSFNKNSEWFVYAKLRITLRSIKSVATPHHFYSGLPCGGYGYASSLIIKPSNIF